MNALADQQNARAYGARIVKKMSSLPVDLRLIILAAAFHSFANFCIYFPATRRPEYRRAPMHAP